MSNFWSVSYQSLSRSSHSDFEYGLHRLSDEGIRFTVDVTSQHLIFALPLTFGVSVPSRDLRRKGRIRKMSTSNAGHLTKEQSQHHM